MTKKNPTPLARRTEFPTAEEVFALYAKERAARDAMNRTRDWPGGSNLLTIEDIEFFMELVNLLYEALPEEIPPVNLNVWVSARAPTFQDTVNGNDAIWLGVKSRKGRKADWKSRVRFELDENPANNNLVTASVRAGARQPTHQDALVAAGWEPVYTRIRRRRKGGHVVTKPIIRRFLAPPHIIQNLGLVRVGEEEDGRVVEGTNFNATTVEDFAREIHGWKRCARCELWLIDSSPPYLDSPPVREWVDGNQNERCYNGMLHYPLGTEEPEEDEPEEPNLEGDEDEPEDGEPQEDDLITEDHVHFYTEGDFAFMVPGGVDASEAEMWTAIDGWMAAHNYFPSVWFISDHGNAHLMVRPPMANPSPTTITIIPSRRRAREDNPRPQDGSIGTVKKGLFSKQHWRGGEQSLDDALEKLHDKIALDQLWEGESDRFPTPDPGMVQNPSRRARAAHRPATPNPSSAVTTLIAQSADIDGLLEDMAALGAPNAFLRQEVEAFVAYCIAAVESAPDVPPEMGITREKAEQLTYRQELFHRKKRDSKRAPVRARVNGAVKTWKRDPERFRIPMKHGLRNTFYIEQSLEGMGSDQDPRMWVEYEEDALTEMVTARDVGAIWNTSYMSRRDFPSTVSAGAALGAPARTTRAIEGWERDPALRLRLKDLHIFVDRDEGSPPYVPATTGSHLFNPKCIDEWRAARGWDESGALGSLRPPEERYFVFHGAQGPWDVKHDRGCAIREPNPHCTCGAFER